MIPRILAHDLLFLFQVGEHAIDYAHVAQKEKLSELQLRVRQLLDQVQGLNSPLLYSFLFGGFVNWNCRSVFSLCGFGPLSSEAVAKYDGDSFKAKRTGKLLFLARCRALGGRFAKNINL